METKHFINQLKLGVILSYVSTGLNMVIQLLYTPIMIKLLGQSEYGLYTLVGSVVSYLSLFSLGFSGSYLRFYSRYRKQEDDEAIARLNGLFLTIFLFMATVALIFGMVLSRNTALLFGAKLTGYELDKAKILMQILIVNIALTFPASVFDSIVTANEQYLFQRLITLGGIVFNPFVCLPLLLMGYGSVAVVGVTTGITVCKLLFNIWFCIRRLHVKFIFRNLDFGLLKEIAGFSFFLFLNMIIDQINWAVDKFILGRVAGTVTVAVYGLGAQINSLYIQFSTAISSVFSPRVNRIVAENGKDMRLQLSELFQKVGRIQFMVLLLIETGFVFFGKYFITNIFATSDYEDSYLVTLLLILPVTIPLIQNLGIEIQRAMNKHQVRSVIYLIMAFANIGISIPLAKSYGPIGSALGTTISLLVANGLIMNIYYSKAIGLDIPKFWKSILSLGKGLILPGIIGCFIFYKIEFSGILSFAMWIIIYALIYVLSMWFFGMNTYEKNLILQPIRKIMKRKSE